jgi:hypothetical protein
MHTGGNVQYMHLFTHLAASLPQGSAVAVALRDLLQAMTSTYVHDAKQLTFTRQHLLHLPAEVLESFHRLSPGLLVSRHELEAQVLGNVGALQGVHGISRYVTSSGCLPHVLAAANGAAEAAHSTPLTSLLLKHQQHAKGKTADAARELQRVEVKLSQVKQQIREQHI